MSVAHWAVVPAAGIGKRMGLDIPKQYLPLGGLSVIEHTLDILLRHPRIQGVVVALGADDRWWPSLKLDCGKPLISVVGGPERCHSVLNGLTALHDWAQPDDWVLVHDAARPCLSRADLDKLLDELADDPVGGLLALPVRDTMKRADAQGRVIATEERAGLWHALTPQMFRLATLLAALRHSLEQGLIVTDEAAAVEAMGLRPRLVQGSADNIKITRTEDLALAEFFLTRRRPA
ncbi:MAG: 2-C-methyl-D-erythritol 4-phosphate cytidylyltransferase [Gammaproteobacteria bacterium]|nr:2-C-methyl-D-erythritol 4-phosphate cytidylyltransferase [Gammaproteobacteria bacterium]MCP5459900.1 2-C-methyl-D-erythritol 4-phosphate cytidylyltransferase [Gammaproteobacteria bacterium]